MSLLNFPNSPATGDTYGFGVNIWEWTGSSWIKSGAITTTSGEDYTWTRPSDWLAMPSMTEGDQKVAALYAIYPGGSGAAISIEGSQGQLFSIVNRLGTGSIFSFVERITRCLQKVFSIYSV